jgi:hypothetical protein
MRRSTTAICVILGAVHALYACGAQKADAITTSGYDLELVAAEPPNPDDPFGACSVVSNGTSFPFQCSVEGAICGGWGGFGNCTPTIEPWVGTVDGACEGSQYYTLCRHDCMTDSDCPDPLTGNATPICSNAGYCQIPCDDDTLCPDGYSCEIALAPTGGGVTEFLPRSCVQRFDSFRFTKPISNPPAHWEEQRNEIDRSGGIDEGPADPDAAFGACFPRLESGSIHARFDCSLEGASCNGFGGHASCNGATEECEAGGYYTACRHDCAADSDCPVPEQGDAQAVCAPAGFCQLPCDDATVCPDGYSCEVTPSGEFLPRICLQRFDYFRYSSAQ